MSENLRNHKESEVVIELSKRQVKAAQLEASGMKAVDIAKQCGISPQTISQYRHLEEYNVLVSKIARATFRAAQMLLIEGTHKAVKTIIDSLDSDSESSRLRAAESLLKMTGMENVENEVGANTVAEYQSKNTIINTDYGIAFIEKTEVDTYLDELGV